MTTLRISKYGIGGNRCSKESTDKPRGACMGHTAYLSSYHLRKTIIIPKPCLEKFNFSGIQTPKIVFPYIIVTLCKVLMDIPRNDLY